MDNLFELLILLVFILSGLNSLFGNKKKRREEMEKEKKQQSPQTQSESTNKNKFPNDEKDLLEELFGIKTEKRQAPDPFEEPAYKTESDYESNYGNYQTQENESTWNPEDDFEKNYDKIETPELTKRQKIFDEIAKIDYDKKIPENIKTQQLEKVDVYSGATEKNHRAIELSKILKNNNSVKQSFLIAEILGKPKALRVRGNNLL